MTNEEYVCLIRSEQDEEKRKNLLSELWGHIYSFVYSIAQKYNTTADIEDLLQEAYFGFYNAVCNYDDTNGSSFITYLAFWLKSYIRRYAYQEKYPHISINMRDKIAKYKRICEQIQKEYGRQATLPEVADRMCISLIGVCDIAAAAAVASTASLDMPLSDEEETTLSDTVPGSSDTEAEVIEAEYAREIAEELWGLVDDLEEDQAAVIRARYQERATLEQVGEMFGKTASNIHTIEAKAMRQLRKSARRSATLQEYKAIYGNSGIYRNHDFFFTHTSSTEFFGIMAAELPHIIK